MGVPRLVKIILEKYSTCHQKVANQPIHYFFMDFNPIIYSCYHTVCKSQGTKIEKMSQARIEKEIIEQVIKKTKHIICDLVKPQKLVYIAIDGPAPRGKMIQQRHRRYRKILEGQYRKAYQEKYEVYQDEPWDTSNITPGTKFMEKLSTALKSSAKAGVFSNHSSVDVIISDSNVPGEGEHKFLPYIEGLKSQPNENYCIFSNDGDLLILGNRFAKDKNIFILTEPNQTSQVVKKLYADEEFMYILMKEFQDGFIEELGLSKYPRDRVIYDYIFFTFFGGNDFVKHFPYTMMKEQNTFNLLNKIYKMLLEQRGEHLIDFKKSDTISKPHINTGFFKDFITELAKREEMGMRNKQKRYDNPSPNKEFTNPGVVGWQLDFIKLQNNYYFKEDHPQYEECGKLFKLINYQDEKEQWRKRFYEHFFGLDTSNFYQFRQERNVIAMQYVKSLVYTLYYYLDEVPSWKWFYPYRMAPLPSDVQSALHHVDDINTIFTFQLGEPFKPFDQLMLVLPPQNIILPDSYRNLMITDELKEFYPAQFELDILAGEKFIYSEPLLPEIDVEKILEATAKEEQNLSQADMKRNTVKTTLIYIPKTKQASKISSEQDNKLTI